MKQKTQIEEVNNNIYDFKKEDNYDFKIKKGLTPEIISEISEQKKRSTMDERIQTKSFRSI